MNNVAAGFQNGKWFANLLNAAIVRTRLNGLSILYSDGCLCNVQRSSSISPPGPPGLYFTCARRFLSFEQSYASVPCSAGSVLLIARHIIQVVSGGVASNQAFRDSLQDIAGMAR